jgi:hypothetical protein
MPATAAQRRARPSTASALRQGKRQGNRKPDSSNGILAGSPKAKGWGWRTLRRNPGVCVRGRVRHPDHATIALHGWHRVVMNTEGQSKARRNVAFLD